jgi:acetyl-CoA synthetase
MYAPHVLPIARGYHALYRSFRWHVPAHYNIGVDVCDRWAQSEPGRTAIFDVRADGTVEEINYGALRETSNRLANVLAAHGIARGDRVAILLPQTAAVAASHIATYKLGAIALPLAMLFGVEAISYRLQDSGARALITNAATPCQASSLCCRSTDPPTARRIFTQCSRARPPISRR